VIIHSDCILAMAEMEPSSIDAIVCDPPYGLEFMGAEWDKPHKSWDKRGQGTERGFKNERGERIKSPVNGPSAFSAGPAFQAWVTQWATEALRVLKPGGSLLSLGGTRTFHRLTCGLEDAGFTIKDCLMWLYGQGFPKAQDLGKMIDKRLGVEREVVGHRPIAYPDSDTWGIPNKSGKIQTDASCNLAPNEIEVGGTLPVTAPASDLARHWDGYKIGGIKPSWEPIIWAVKPPEGAWIDNVLKYGVGAVNVDECRVGSDPGYSVSAASDLCGDGGWKDVDREGNPKGRFPANLLLSHTPDCREVGTKRVKPRNGSGKCSGNTTADKSMFGMKGDPVTYCDPDGLETVEAWECAEDCPVRLLDEQSGVLTSGNLNAGHKRGDSEVIPYGGGGVVTGNYGGDTGGASRFFYTSKATNRDSYNDHPTLKPTDLIEWLIRLVTRPGQTVLDPFMGSGTTLVAAIQCAREAIGIEQDRHYCDIAERRLKGTQMGMF